MKHKNYTSQKQSILFESQAMPHWTHHAALFKKNVRDGVVSLNNFGDSPVLLV